MQKRIKSFDRNNLIVLLEIAFTLAFFAPIEIFFSNSKEIWMDIYDFLPMCSIVFVALAVILLAVFLMVTTFNAKWGEVFCSIAFSVNTILYVLGNFVPARASMMDDGTSINWCDINNNMIDVLIISFVTLVLILLFWKSGNKRLKVFCTISVCLFLLQIYTLGVASFISPGNGWEKREQPELTEKNLFTYSTESNFTILVLDQFDARMFTYYLEKGNEHIDALDGFTYYPDTVCKYNFTDCAVPHMVSGNEFKHQTDFTTYLEGAYSNSPFIKELSNAQYDVNVYTYDVPGNAVKDIYDNCVVVDMGISSHRKLIMYIYRLVGCKYLPFWFKQFCWFPSDDLDDLKDIEGVDDTCDEFELQPVNYANTNFYNKLNLMNSTNKRMFHFIHLRGIHGPWSHDEYMHETDQSGEYLVAEGVLYLVDEWLDDLRQIDAYDNNVIIIMGDHGSMMETDEDDRSQNPLFLVKGFDEHHALEISKNRVSYDQLQEIYKRLLEGETASKAVEDYNKDRKFFKCEKYKYAEGELREYCVDGFAWEINRIHETGNVYTP